MSVLAALALALAAAQAAPAVAPAAAPISPAADAKVGAAPAGPPGTVTLRGLVSSQTLAAADIAQAPHVHVVLDVHGTPVDYSGPLVSDLLRAVDAPLGVRMHGAGVNDVVFVTGADRFRAVLSLAELDPGFHRGAKVILADQADGKPITGKQGPYRLVIDGDLRPARSVYAVTSIELKHLP